MVSTSDRPLIYTLKNVYLKDQRTRHDYQSLTYAVIEISILILCKNLLVCVSDELTTPL